MVPGLQITDSGQILYEGRIKDLHIVSFECDVKMKPSIIDTNEETVNSS